MRFLQKELEVFIRDVTALGGIYFHVILLLFLLLAGVFTLFYRILAGIIAIYVVAVFLRLIYFKDRPLKQRFTTMIEKLDASAFPSIHSARAAFLVVVLSDIFATLILTVLFIIVGALICYSRVHLEKHDWIDVGVGVLVGIILGFLAVVFI